jgi:Zn-dependent peptidase ImmA (M78 family)/predicted secreted protein
MNRAEVGKHRRAGSLRAQRALRDINADFETPVDVFGCVEREQVWLMFQPLDSLYGAYRRHETPGIVIHNGHPTRLQRFTAAHELGHHLLGHEISIDSQEEVENAAAALPAQEVEAQAFAATFLMPVQLVNRGLARIGLKRRPEQLDPGQAYRLSLELGASYTATVTQMHALERISAANARALHQQHPIDIKTDLALGHRPANARADVWPLAREDDGRTVWVSPEDEVHIRLNETPTTGYRWRLADLAEDVTLVGDERVERGEDERVYGATRTRHVWWRALAPADTAVAAELARSFDPDGIAERFQVALHVVANPIGDAEQGVSRRQLKLS